MILQRGILNCNYIKIHHREGSSNSLFILSQMSHLVSVVIHLEKAATMRSSAKLRLWVRKVLDRHAQLEEIRFRDPENSSSKELQSSCIMSIFFGHLPTPYILARQTIWKKELRNIKTNLVNPPNTSAIFHRLNWFILKNILPEKRPCKENGS